MPWSREYKPHRSNRQPVFRLFRPPHEPCRIEDLWLNLRSLVELRHAALHFVVYWLLSFYSLALALFLLNLYFGHLQSAMFILFAFGSLLAVIAFFARSL